MADPFNPKETSVVGYVNAQNQTLLGIVNSVSSEGNPNLAVVTQVVNPPRDDSGQTPGSWRYLSDEEIVALQTPPVIEENTAPIEPVVPMEPTEPPSDDSTTETPEAPAPTPEAETPSVPSEPTPTEPAAQ